MTNETPEQAPKQGRLSVNINAHTSNVIRREMTYEDGLNATEIVGRAIALYGTVQELRRAGYSIATAYKRWDWFGDRYHKLDSILKLSYPARDAK